jgi:hypothetical protein
MSQKFFIPARLVLFIPAEAASRVLHEFPWIPGRASYRQLTRNDSELCQRTYGTAH